MQLHNPDPAVPLESVAEVFARFIEEGKVRHVGVSNMNRDELNKWLELMPDTVSIQLPYSLLDRSRVEEVFDSGEKPTLSLIPWAPLFLGFLAKTQEVTVSEHEDIFSMFRPQFLEAAL